MIRHLKPLGTGSGLVIEAPILELLGIDENTPLHISTDGEALIIRPVRTDDRASRLAAAAERLMDEHDETFRKLAQ